MPSVPQTRLENQGTLHYLAHPAPEGDSSGVRAPRDPAAQDEDDVALARSGDPAAFERLVLRHQDSVISTAYYHLGNYEDAVDVAQEAFLKAYRGLPRFRGQAAFRTWLLTIALNTARSLQSHRRAKKRARKTVPVRATGAARGEGAEGGGIDPPDPDGSSQPRTLLERKEIKEALEAAILELDEQARQVVVLRDLAGESYESISTALDLPLGTVKSRVHRARLELQARLMRWVG